ncbi:MAG: hypothetical protein JO215_00825, partial [Ktedonobacteraceae bacterium]|nr:hypothetical protein [Ktedonobacteraceae bacterium]
MLRIVHSLHGINIPGLVLLLLLWLLLFKGTRLLVTLLRHDPLVGWAIGPLGITIMFAHEPSILFIWLSLLCPAVVSGSVLYVGLFTPLSPVPLSHNPAVQVVVIGCGVLLSIMGDTFNAFQDLRHPLWGEARILRSIQWIRATWARVHFT